MLVGGGFIALEMAENLTRLGLDVTVVEMLPQVMPPIDAEMVAPVHEHLIAQGVKLALGTAVAGFAQKDGHLEVQTKDGAMQRADKNVDDLLETLHGTYHRLRQSSVDEELFDVISGYEALAKGRALVTTEGIFSRCSSS